MSKINPHLVVNFNYTSTHTIYGIEDSKVKYIHGKVGSDTNNIVMGMNIYDLDYDKRFVYFMKFFQRMQKRTDILLRKDFDMNYMEKASDGSEYFNYKPGYNDSDVFFYGHSMSNADGDIIELLRNNDKFKFTIFYYDQLDYEGKVINLLNIFKKDKTIEMIHNREIKFLPVSDIAIKG